MATMMARYGRCWCIFATILLRYLSPAASAASILPAPIVISPSQYWEGNDGPWSTFTLQVGTPAQNIRALISTAGSATWVVVPEGCVLDGPSNCADLRGQDFQPNASTTWEFNDYYELLLESNLGYTGSGEFGFDRVGLGWQGSGGPVLDHQVIAGIATEDFWIGSFGLTPRPTNFTDFNDPQPSFMETLQNKSLIPSLSWSYTAGAPYRLEKVPGSLVLGGYDASKAGSTNLTFDFAPDISRDLTVGIQGISVSTDGQINELLPTRIFSFIDSTTPYIWLPPPSCLRFEQLLGLIWNSSLELYLVNNTLHSELLAKNLTFTFKIGNATQGEPTIDITLPYASFDLTVDYPVVTNATRYFPLKRAANESQHTLGRTFLQEAYLTVDYSRSQFQLSQTRFDPGVPEHIIAIFPPNSTTASTSTNPSSTKALSSGPIAGIVIGSILFLAILATLIYLYLRRRRKRRSTTPLPPAWSPEKDPGYGGFGKAELDAKDTAHPGQEVDGVAAEKHELAMTEVGHESSVASPELLSPVSRVSRVSSGREEVAVHEMEGDGPVVGEMEAGVERPREIE